MAKDVDRREAREQKSRSWRAQSTCQSSSEGRQVFQSDRQ